MTREIPPELGDLLNLDHMGIANNAIVGTVPSELGRLVNLGVRDTSGLSGGGGLNFQNNRLTGALPQSLVQLKYLRHLNFSRNLDLCAPSNQEFQNWLNTLTRRFGPTCAKVSFSGDIDDQSYPRSHSISSLILPVATSGVQPIVYTFNVLELPVGLQYDHGTHTMSGTPLEVTPPVLFTYKAVNVTRSEDSLQFNIEVYFPVSTEQDELPQTFDLRSNYPNPFQHSTQVVFDLP